MGHIVVKDFQSKTKISSSLYIEDLIFVVSYPFFMWMMFDGIVSSRLTVPYVIFNCLVALWLMQRLKSNPGKQRYQMLLFMLRRDTMTYHMIPAFTEKEVNREDDYGQGK